MALHSAFRERRGHPMKLDFVQAISSDRSFFIHVHHTAYRDTIETMFGWNKAVQDDFAKKAFDPGGIKVIWFDGQRVGVVGWEQYPDYIWLKEVFVLPSKQGQGIGSAVIRYIKAIAEDRNLPVRLRTLKANQRAKALYERNGFTVSDTTDVHWNMVWR